MAAKEIGKVIHWFDKINVAVLKLSAPLKKGDVVSVRRGEQEFEETISSMQIDHEDVDAGKKGDEVAVKFSNKTKEGATIYSGE